MIRPVQTTQPRSIAMIDNIAKRITAETTPIWRCD